ncbi:hypothetical protein CFC21_089949 [Triticum aestivum]|uniref:dUTP diphosphatase n=1 Tax=Triticum aestivum TaxID=4565 RepID=A0A9R1LDE2_WHEAT|nr:hypothetical protein CFC21_089949 [Triticum aestivum]
MVVRKCCVLVCELQTLSSSKVIAHMPTTKMHIYWLREQQHNSDDSANIYLQGPEGMLMLRRHLSYLQKERTRPSSCLVAVSSFDSFVQQRGDLAFFMSLAKRVIDTDYDSLVGVVLFNHLEVDFDVKPIDRAARMIVHVIMMPDIAEVEHLDTIFQREGGFGSSGV